MSGGAGAASTRDRVKIKKRSVLLRDVRDASEAEEYNHEKQMILAAKRRSLVLDIKRFLRDARDSEQKAELNLRLGGLYMEDYYSLLAKAQSDFDKATQAYEAQGGKKNKARPPKFDNSEAIASIDRARAIYRDLVGRYPKHPRRDEMLYFMAMATMDRGKTDEAMSYFKRLVEETPKSRYVNDTLVQLGDHFFEKNQWAVSETYYDKIVQRKYKPLFAYAVYKKGWIAYNLGKPEVALKNFKWVVQNEDVEDSGAPVRIKGEALKDIALIFVDLKMLNEAIAFYRQYGAENFRKSMEVLAGLFYEKGLYKEAVVSYETLLALDANHPKNPSYDISIIEALRLANNPSAAIGRLFSRLPGYMENSGWYELNVSNPTVVKEAQSSFEETARKFAFQIHAEGQKTKNDALYNTAKQLYAKYIEYFPKSPHSPKVRFYLAEILYKQNFFLSAADQYYLVYKDPGAGALKLEGIRYALSSVDRQLSNERKKAGLAHIDAKHGQKLKAGVEETLQVVPYNEAEQKFVEISTEYLTHFGKQKDAPDVLYTQAYLLYSHHELSKAYSSFWSLLQTYPAHETAMSSAYLILDILNRNKDYGKLIAACRKMLENKSFNKPTFRAEVADILRKAELKRISMMEEKGDHKEAALAYIEYTKAYGTQDESLFEKALFNASVNFQKANLLTQAVETQEKFLRRFPKSAMRQDMLLQVAKTYEGLANFEKAAQYFELFSTSYTSHAQAKPALRLAGLYYWGAGNPKRAEQVMTLFVKSYPAEAKMVERDLLDLYDSVGATDREISFYITARAQKGIPISQYVAYSVKIAELQAEKYGRPQPAVLNEGLSAAQRFSKDILKTPHGVEAVSKLFLWVAQQKENQFYAYKLALPQATLEANLQRKLALLKELEKDFLRIAGLGSAEWGLSAIYRTAAIYRHMAVAVAQAPVPNELSAEQIEMYRAEIAKQMVKPFNEKALALTVQCLDKAQEFNLMSSWTPKCYSLAAELQPERYPLARTFYLPSLQTALFLPEKESKMNVGSVKYYAYPFYSSGLFRAPSAERSPASTPQLPALMDANRSSEGSASAPVPMHYAALSDERNALLKKALESERPASTKEGYSFSFLNLMRVTQPHRAQPLILQAIQRDPGNHALHNLLGLTFLEAGNLPAAKVVWLSLTARGVKKAAIYNNLGIVALQENREGQAIAYFEEAISVGENIKEALINLGFLALKYRNGFEAKKHFEKALSFDKEDVSAQVGIAEAQLQNREIDAAKDGLIELAKKYRKDPYARLSLGYLLIDIEKEGDLARRVLTEYMEQNNDESDLLFRQAIQETKQMATGGGEGGGSGGSLPDIE